MPDDAGGGRGSEYNLLRKQTMSIIGIFRVIMIQCVSPLPTIICIKDRQQMLL